MKIFVYLRDGRTVFLIEKRGLLGKLCAAEPWGDEDASVFAVRGIWDAAGLEYRWTQTRLRYRHEIGFVEEARGLADVLPQRAAA